MQREFNTHRAGTMISPTNSTNRVVSDISDVTGSVFVANVKNTTETLIRQAVESSEILLEQILPRPYALSYACLMLPRFNTHYLAGDLAELLYHQMNNICISFDWHLEFIDIRREYLQWIMIVDASTSPATFIRIIQQQTSKEIFEELPRLKRENRSDNFWASAYMVLAGSQPYPSEMINEFIKHTRQQQGHFFK
jgi:REP element-mobilizing transposase RayT